MQFYVCELATGRKLNSQQCCSLNAFDIIAMVSEPAIQRMIESAHDDKSLSSNPSTQFTTATQARLPLFFLLSLLSLYGELSRKCCWSG